MNRQEHGTVIYLEKGWEMAAVFTEDAVMKNRMARLLAQKPDAVTRQDGAAAGTELFLIPSKWVRIRPPAERFTTPEERAAATKPLRAYDGHRKKRGKDEAGNG